MSGAEQPRRALSDKEWKGYRERGPTFDSGLNDVIANPDPEFPARAIAIANDRIADSDPRKITKARVMRLRDAAEQLDHHGGPSPAWDLRRLAIALESYLPSE